jgi:hypothetical protein
MTAMGKPRTAKQNGEGAEFKDHRTRFFALVGRCVTTYQTVEDHLQDLFAAALGGDPDRASAIFVVVRGLTDKLTVITAALTTQEHRVRWDGLSGRVQAAFEARNQIAHARPLVNGGATLIVLSGDPALPSTTARVVHEEPSRMELRKRTRKSEMVWTEDRLRDEHARMAKLFGHLVAFGMQLRGETPPPHLGET